MRIDAPHKSQIRQLRRLWMEAFADGEDSLNAFIRTAMTAGRCRCVTVDGTVAAALYWFECRCRGRKVAYLYAVATAKAFRGQGLCHALMADTHRHLEALGYEGAVLVPATDALFGFYETMGYQTCSQIREFTCEAADQQVQLFPVSPSEYAKRRRLLLPEGGVVQEEENLDYLETQAKLYAGPNLLLAARTKGDVLEGLELLGDTVAAPGILHGLGCSRGSFRVPGEDRAFAMYLPLGGSCFPAPTYFGLAFD